MVFEEGIGRRTSGFIGLIFLGVLNVFRRILKVRTLSIERGGDIIFFAIS